MSCHEALRLARLLVDHPQTAIPSTLAPQPMIGTSSASNSPNSDPDADPAPRLGWTTVLPARDERLIHINLGICEAFPASRPNTCQDSHHA